MADELKGCKIPSGRELVFTQNSNVYRIPSVEIEPYLAPCNHEEADSRMFLHAYESAEQGYSRVTIRSPDTDVFVIAISCFPKLNVEYLWIHAGTVDEPILYPIHDIYHDVGSELSSGLPAFHALSGCDQLSGFAGHGKRSCWNKWMCNPELNLHLARLSCSSERLPYYVEAALPVFQRFVSHLYGIIIDTYDSIDEARYQLARQGKTFLQLPPTADARRQLLLRVALVAGHVWGNCLN